jgi:hypothetical protein
VITTETRRGVRTAGRGRGIGRAEPESEVIGVDRLGRGTLVRIRERRLIVHDGRRLAAGRLRDDERLGAEDALEALVPFAVVVRLDVALVPGETERRRRQLEHEEVELGVRRQPRDVDVHPLDAPE